MKASIDKSKLMKRAWSIYRRGFSSLSTFSACLSRAWEIEKAYAVKAVEEAMKEVDKVILPKCETSAVYSVEFNKGIADYYSNASRGQYFGD